jgi:hypothetical protein
MNEDLRPQPGGSDALTAFERLVNRRFVPLVAILCGFYLVIELAYIYRQPFAHDEFAGAYAVRQFLTGLPYRDFRPYKTVLGYYLQLPVLALSLALTSDPWTGMQLVKTEMAVLNTAAFLLAALALARHFRKTAVFGGLVMLVCMSTVLEQSSVLRVDMLTALFGLASLLWLMNKSFALAGLACAVSFLVSQKGVYYFLAANAALAAWFAVRGYGHSNKDTQDEQDSSGSTARGELAEGGRAKLAEVRAPSCISCPSLLKAAVRFDLPALGLVLLYIFFWSAFSSVRTVCEVMFVQSARVAFTPLFDIHHFWLVQLARNPLFWAAAPAALVWLYLKRREGPVGPSLRRSGFGRAGGSTTPSAPDDGRMMTPRAGGPGSFVRVTLLAYGAAILALAAWHKQPWPFSFVLFIPTVFVLLVSLLDGLVAESSGLRRGPDRAEAPRYAPRTKRLALAVFLLVGVVFPLTRVPVALRREAGFQRHMVRLADALLEPGETYLAGVDVVYTREQATNRLRWLDPLKLAALHSMSAGELREILREIEDSPLKLLVMNRRLMGLPVVLRRYLMQNYARAWGNIYVYAPRVDPGARTLELKFPGVYEIVSLSDGDVAGDAPDATDVVVDGRPLWHGERIRLSVGRHECQARVPCQLKLAPESLGRHAHARYREPFALFSKALTY